MKCDVVTVSECVRCSLAVDDDDDEEENWLSYKLDCVLATFPARSS